MLTMRKKPSTILQFAKVISTLLAPFNCPHDQKRSRPSKRNHQTISALKKRLVIHHNPSIQSNTQSPPENANSKLICLIDRTLQSII